MSPFIEKFQNKQVSRVRESLPEAGEGKELEDFLFRIMQIFSDKVIVQNTFYWDLQFNGVYFMTWALFISPNING